jgi:hypothetical protein
LHHIYLIGNGKEQSFKGSNPTASSIKLDFIPTVLARSDTEKDLPPFNSGNKENLALLTDNDFFSFHENEIEKAMWFMVALHNFPEDESLESQNQMPDFCNSLSFKNSHQHQKKFQQSVS